jgi:hypothetical protein
MNLPGDRPNAEPIFRGEFEPETVYMSGDTVTSEGQTWRALNDFRSGFLPPSLVDKDVPGVFWELV